MRPSILQMLISRRNDGVIEVMAMMKIIGDDIKNNVGLISTDLPPVNQQNDLYNFCQESITIINDFTNSLSGPTPTYRMQTRKKGANVVSELDIMSTLPNFKNIKLPVHNNDLGTGHEEFLLSFGNPSKLMADPNFSLRLFSVILFLPNITLQRYPAARLERHRQLFQGHDQRAEFKLHIPPRALDVERILRAHVDARYYDREQPCNAIVELDL